MTCRYVYFVLLIAAIGLLRTSNLALGEAVWIEDPNNSSSVTVKMEVTAADEPSPAFKYRLSLRPHELVPGNSTQHYMRAFPEGEFERIWRFLREQHGEEIDTWYGTDMPISQLPLERMKKASDLFQSTIDDYLRPGASCRDTDWGIDTEYLKGPQIISFLLPEFQASRSMARGLALNTRFAIAERRYDDAIDQLRIGYRFGRDVGSEPILVCNLVGIAICGITNFNTIDLIAAPNSPNLYWALSEMPSPQVSLRDSLRLEMAIGPRMFTILDEPEKAHRTKSEWNALWMREARLVNMYADFDLVVEPLEEDVSIDKFDTQNLLPAMLGVNGYTHAKKRLVDWGYDAEKVEEMAVGQVLSIYSARVYQMISDETEKAYYAPYSQALQLASLANRTLAERGPLSRSLDREILPVATFMLPAVSAARSATVRLERDLALLRTIEALRMHAAQNNGVWPTRLESVTCVPVPDNPATGRPFMYELDGRTAVLTLPSSDGIYGYRRRYELTIAQPQNN